MVLTNRVRSWVESQVVQFVERLEQEEQVASHLEQAETPGTL